MDTANLKGHLAPKILSQIAEIKAEFLENGKENERLVIELSPLQVSRLIQQEIKGTDGCFHGFKALLEGSITRLFLGMTTFIMSAQVKDKIVILKKED
jgi:hypothetical protein